MFSINTITSGIRAQEEYYTQDESLEAEFETEQEEYNPIDHIQDESQMMTQAVWHGQGAKRLGLEGIVLKEDFEALFYGHNPQGGQRIRGAKLNPEAKDRLGHGLTFAAPKSVSMALHLGGDTRVFQAHMEAVKETLDEMEPRYAQSRIQVNGDRRVLNTGNLTIALIPHHTSRCGDMHLHTHAFVMNGTQGPDGTWRALWHESLKDAQWIGSLYRQKLAKKLQTLGYELEQTKDRFEIKGVSQEAITLFSKRSQAIVKHLEQQKLEINPQNRDWATLTTRGSKPPSQTLAQLQQRWRMEATAIGIEVPQPGKFRLSLWAGGAPARS